MGELFDFERYEIGLAVLGLVMLLAAWIPQLFLKRHVTLAVLHLVTGYAAFSLVDIDLLNPFEETPRWVWEKMTELAVIISLLGAGLKIDENFTWDKWKPTVLLLAITMPLTILGVYLFGYYVIGLPIATAILLGAVLAPTDPVIAADVQVGPPQEGPRTNHVRFPLTSEAGLNDSLAFPFTYLAIVFAANETITGDILGTWALKAVLYKGAVGVIGGLVVARLLALIIFKYPTDKPLAREGLGCIALCVILLSYGVTELLAGYGFLAVFICALRLRRVSKNHEYHTELYNFSENLERSAMAIVLFLLGGLATVLLDDINTYSWLLAIAVLFFIRPLTAVLALLFINESKPTKFAISFFGIRGIGSIYYLAYAMGAAQFASLEWVWASVILIIFISSIVHGISAFPVMKWVDRMNEKHSPKKKKVKKTSKSTATQT
jgi:NhaP-type Na+/H+ or K+/H+ antiporter